MVRSFLASAAIFALATSGAGFGTSAAQEQAASTSRLPLEGIAAIVNDQPISYSDVRQRARLLLLSLGGQQPGPEQIQQITGQALEQLIDERLQLEKAGEFEVEVDQASIQAQVEDMARQSGSTGDDLRAQLLSSGVNPVSLEDQMRADTAWNRLMGGLYGNRIRISENQVEEQLRRLRAASKETQYRVGEIFLYAPDDESKSQALEAADSIISQLNQGADFRIAAQRLSSAPTAATGGDMGWVAPDDISDVLAQVIQDMPGPGLSAPITVDNGVYILNVANKREPTEQTTKVDLIRLVATDGSETDLKAAIDEIETCEDVSTAANIRSNLSFADLEDIDVDSLGPEGRSMVMSAPVGGPTDIFAASGGLAVMYVCRRDEGAEALPSRENIKDTLKNRELSLISERELRDLRREATIIYR